MLIDIYWVKFEDGEIDCFCRQDRKKCPAEKIPLCKEYVLKFIKVERNIEDIMQEPMAQLKKKMTELQKSINKFKV